MAKYEKTAYTNGQEAAYSAYGVPQSFNDDGDQPAPAPQHKPLLAQHLPQQKSSPSWLPALGIGALGAFGAYHGMRMARTSANPAVKAIQQVGAEKGFHRVVDVSKRTPDPSAPWYRRAFEATYPQVSKPGKDLDWVNKAKLWLHEGSDAIPIAQGKKGQPYIPGHPNGIDTDGWVMDRRMLNNKLIRGGHDIEGPMETQQHLTRMESKGKNFESDMLAAHAPDAVPRTLTKIHGIFKPGDTSTPQGRIEAARQLQQNVHQHMTSNGVDRYIMKPSRGFQSGGFFPGSAENWSAHMAKYERHFADPKNAAAFEKIKANDAGGEEAVDYLKRNGLYEGHVLNQAIRDPSSVQAQEYMPGTLGEYRVHTMQGVVAPGMTAPRGLATNGQKRNIVPKMEPGEMDAMHQFVEHTLSRLPPEYRKGMYGMDVAHFRDPATGKPNFKIVEMNQHVLPTQEDPFGAGSGFLDSFASPFTAHQHQRSVTGRHTHPVALGAAAGIGLGGLAATRAYQDLTSDDGDQDAHPVG